MNFFHECPGFEIVTMKGILFVVNKKKAQQLCFQVFCVHWYYFNLRNSQYENFWQQ